MCNLGSHTHTHKLLYSVLHNTLTYIYISIQIVPLSFSLPRFRWRAHSHTETKWYTGSHSTQYTYSHTVNEKELVQCVHTCHLDVVVDVRYDSSVAASKSILFLCVFFRHLNANIYLWEPKAQDANEIFKQLTDSEKEIELIQTHNKRRIRKKKNNNNNNNVVLCVLLHFIYCTCIKPTLFVAALIAAVVVIRIHMKANRSSNTSYY